MQPYISHFKDFRKYIFGSENDYFQVKILEYGILNFEKSSGTGNYWKFQIVLVTGNYKFVRKGLAPSQLVDNLNWKSQPS